jgi:hypothetical protein
VGEGLEESVKSGGWGKDRVLLVKLRENCEKYDMDGVEDVVKELEKNEYEEDGELVTWIREMVDMSKLGDVAKRLKDF